MEEIINKLAESYKNDPQNLDFNISMYLDGPKNKELRRAIIHKYTGKLPPNKKATVFLCADVLKNKFNQPELF